MIITPKTHENFLKLGTTDSEGILEFNVPAPSRTPRSMLDEAILAAKLISQKLGPEIFLPLSGGVDSEAMAEAFRLAGVDFTAIILEFNDGHNEFDIVDARKYCKRHSIRSKIISIDLDNFFSSNEHLRIAEKYQCRSPQIAVHLHGFAKVEGSVVLPHNPIALYNRRESFYWEFPQNLYLSYDRFFSLQSIESVSFFFLYTPELIYSYASLPIYRELLSRDRKFWNRFSRDPYLVKCELYRQGGFDVWPRTGKATGFEKYRRHLNRIHKGQYDGDFFDERYRKPMEKIVNDSGLRHTGKLDLNYLYSMWKMDKIGT